MICYDRVSSNFHQTAPAKEFLRRVWQEIHSEAKFLGSLVLVALPSQRDDTVLQRQQLP